LNREGDDPRAADAVALFCYSVRKWIGAFAAALGGVDALVFSGGIGENSPLVRARICAGLEFLGIELDRAGNQFDAALISAFGGRVAVRVIRTDEELVIARAVRAVLAAPLDNPASQPAMQEAG
jgi:acetate kinase